MSHASDMKKLADNHDKRVLEEVLDQIRRVAIGGSTETNVGSDWPFGKHFDFIKENLIKMGYKVEIQKPMVNSTYKLLNIKWD